MTLDSLANIPAPAYAQHVAEWVNEDGDGMHWGRYVRGARLATGGAEVALVGWQDASAAVEWHANFFAADYQVDAAGLRRLAAIALDAADELDQLAG
jgi:hypothetical protein